MTVRRNKFPFNNQPDASIRQIYSVTKLYTFRASSLPIIRSFLGTGKFHAEFMTAGSGHQSCMKLTSAECTVENS